MKEIRQMLSDAIDGYKRREGQEKMIKDVMETISDKDVLLARGEVGVGKSMAYLLPNIIKANFPLVVATSSKTLQDQLVEKDLPAVSDVLDKNLSFVSLKGIKNYLCKRLYEESDVVVDNDDGTKPDKIDWEDWDEISVSSSACLKKKCNHYEECFYHSLREKAHNSDVIVVNHHLLAADIMIKQITEKDIILPSYSSLVIDEIHDFEDSVISFFTKTLSKKTIEQLVSKFSKAVGEINPKLYNNAENLGNELNYLVELSKEVDFKGLEKQIDQFARRNEGELIKKPLKELSFQSLKKLSNEIALTYGDIDGNLEVPAELKSFNRHLEDIIERLENLKENPDNVAIWAESTKRGSYRIKLANIDVSGFLEGFWGQSNSFILSSATIPFDFVEDRLGIPESKRSEYDSPFDYQKQANLIIPKGCNPKKDNWTSQVCEYASKIIDRGHDKTLLLCTSYKTMDEIVPAIKKEFRSEYTILQQSNNFSKGFLLEQLQQKDKAILIAQAASFGTGVDIKGNKNIILTKLNFDVPNDPLFMAKSDVIEANGGNPFMELSIPNVIIRTKQQIGRSIRSSNDKANIAIFDDRLYKKYWGRKILNSLPKMKLYKKL